MDELERMHKKYININTEFILFCDVEKEKVEEAIQKVKPFERPDIISMVDDKIIAIEHFEFDCYNRTKKGSKYKREYFIMDKKLKGEMLEKLENNNEASVHGKIIENTSLSNYINNFKESYEEHYNKIENYNQNIIEKFSCDKDNIINCFLIEDTTPLGVYYLDDKRKQYNLIPIKIEEILDFISERKKVKYLIFPVMIGQERKVIILENKEKYINMFKETLPTITEDNFFTFQPNTFGIGVKVSNDKIEDIESGEERNV